MSLESAQQVLNQAIKAGKSEFDKKFGLPSGLSRSVRDYQFQHSLNDLESFRDVIVKGVKETMANIDLSNGGLNQVCEVIDQNIEKCQHRFFKAYSRFPTYDPAEQWENFLVWMGEFRAGVRSEILAAIEEDAEEGVENIDYVVETTLVDNREITEVLFEKYGYSTEVNELMHDLVLAVTAGETEDVETAMDLFLTKFSDEAKRELRNILDNKKAELRGKKLELDELKMEKIDLMEQGKRAMSATVATYETQNNLTVDAYEKKLEEAGQRIEELEMLLQFSENAREDLQQRIKIHFENAKETAEVNRAILGELETANRVADRRLAKIVFLQEKLTEALQREEELAEAVKRLRKTRRTRSVNLNLCTDLPVCSVGSSNSSCDDSDIDQSYEDDFDLEGTGFDSGDFGDDPESEN